MRNPNSERLPLVVTILTLIGLPLGLFAYERVCLPLRHPGARVIHLTAVAADGVWTREHVTGINYWRKRFSSSPEIHVQQGEKVLLRLASADVLHSFAIPALNIGPFEVPAGEVRQVEFTADKPGRMVFLCWQVCSPVHEKLRGMIVIIPPEGQAPVDTSPDEPELG